jgi:MFS family permease
VAVGYSLGLAASVLYLGALGDRHGRKAMALGGVLLSIPACLVAGFAPSIGVLIAARILGGLSAGMAYPTSTYEETTIRTDSASETTNAVTVIASGHRGLAASGSRSRSRQTWTCWR